VGSLDPGPKKRSRRGRSYTKKPVKHATGWTVDPPLSGRRKMADPGLIVIWGRKTKNSCHTSTAVCYKTRSPRTSAFAGELSDQNHHVPRVVAVPQSVRSRGLSGLESFIQKKGKGWIRMSILLDSYRHARTHTIVQRVRGLGSPLRREKKKKNGGKGKDLSKHEAS